MDAQAYASDIIDGGEGMDTAVFARSASHAVTVSQPGAVAALIAEAARATAG